MNTNRTAAQNLREDLDYARMARVNAIISGDGQAMNEAQVAYELARDAVLAMEVAA
jgi:hypothetical protein